MTTDTNPGAQNAGNAWQGIESAPMDGAPIIAAWRCAESGKQYVSGDVFNAYGNWLSEAHGLIYPTHWMPLPTPPQEPHP